MFKHRLFFPWIRPLYWRRFHWAKVWATTLQALRHKRIGNIKKVPTTISYISSIILVDRHRISTALKHSHQFVQKFQSILLEKLIFYILPNHFSKISTSNYLFYITFN